MKKEADMTPREMGRGLMRGDRGASKLGYTWENALKAVLEQKGADASELEDYLVGYADGLAGRSASKTGDAYHEGFGHGWNENPERVNPADQPAEHRIANLEE